MQKNPITLSITIIRFIYYLLFYLQTCLIYAYLCINIVSMLALKSKIVNNVYNNVATWGEGPVQVFVRVQVQVVIAVMWCCSIIVVKL